MPTIEIKVDRLHNRTNQMSALLAPFRKNGQSVGCSICRKLYAGCKALSAHDGSGGGDNFNTWYFRTYAKNILAQYYELWKPGDQPGKLKLWRAYLHLVIDNRTTQNYDKLVAIHCDPYDDCDEPLRSYKRGPHLHVENAEQPIPNSHFPLNLMELNNILSSINNITKALELAIQVLCNEVLNRYPKH